MLQLCQIVNLSAITQKLLENFGRANRSSKPMVVDPMDDLRFRKIFNLGITKDISGKKLSKLEKLQSLVAKCCKIRKI